VAWFDEMITGIKAFLQFIGVGRQHSAGKKKVAHIGDPDALANYLVRDFAATLFVIPQAIQGLSPENAAAFLLKTKEILSDLGYEKRCRLLVLFAAFIETGSIKNLESLCAFIDDPAQDDLKKSLDDEGNGDAYYAVVVLSYLSQLMSRKATRVSSKRARKQARKRARPVQRDFQGKEIKILSTEQKQIHKEWKAIRELLKKLDAHSSSPGRDDRRVRWQRQRDDQLKKLHYLSFFSPAIIELSDKLLSLSRD
jgi:hypothetical protein